MRSALCRGSPVYTLPASAIIAEPDEDFELEEITPPKAVEGSTMEHERICALEGCTKRLTERNSTGYCSEHWYESKKKSKGAGAKPGPKGPRKSADSGTGTATGKPIANRGPEPPACNEAAESVTIELTEKRLDFIWSRLTVREKANLLFPSESSPV